MDGPWKDGNVESRPQAKGSCSPSRVELVARLGCALFPFLPCSAGVLLSFTPSSASISFLTMACRSLTICFPFYRQEYLPPRAQILSERCIISCVARSSCGRLPHGRNLSHREAASISSPIASRRAPLPETFTTPHTSSHFRAS